MPALTPELDALVLQWNNHAPSYDSWPNSLPIVSISELHERDLDKIYQWGYQAGSLSISRIVRTKNITVNSDELCTPLPGVDKLHRVNITRPIPVGSSVIEPSKNIVVLVAPGVATSSLWVIEMGCSHLNIEHTNIGNLLERFRCADCEFEYEIDHGD